MAKRQPQRSTAPDSPPTTPPTTPEGRQALKGAKFIELARKRMKRVITQLRLLGNLSNSSSYYYTEAQIAKMHQVLAESVNAAFARFARGTNKKEDTFDF